MVIQVCNSVFKVIINHLATKCKSSKNLNFHKNTEKMFLEKEAKKHVKLNHTTLNFNSWFYLCLEIAELIIKSVNQKE